MFNYILGKLYGRRMAWKCRICGRRHSEIPTCFGMDAPWRTYVPELEFKGRVQLSPDRCIIDDNAFFVRGHIEIPIIDHPEPFALSVWCSLSEKSFIHINERWNDNDRDSDEPYFGWLSNSIPIYPETMNLKTHVQSRAVGKAPIIIVEPTEHPLAVDQRNGISKERWHLLAQQILVS